jgi:hypothetical protein
MTNPENGVIRTLKIIIGALFLGAATFLAIVTYLVMTGEAAGDPGPLARILLGVWAALVVGSLVAWPIVRRKQASLAAAALSEGGEKGRLAAAQHYVASTIVGGALAEGASLLASAGGLATGHPGLLAASVVSLFGIVLLFPSQQKFERFVESGGGRHVPTSPS